MSVCWSGEPDYVERLEARMARLQLRLAEAHREIERLRAISHIAPQHRNETIEECARKIEAEAYDHDDMVRLAAAIRALKEDKS